MCLGNSPLTPAGEAAFRQEIKKAQEVAHDLMGDQPAMLGKSSEGVRGRIERRAKELRKMADDLDALSAALPLEVPPQASAILSYLLLKADL